MSEIAIEFKNVTKSYGELQAIDNLNLTIKKGIIFGLVGSSGAGKSTLLRTINLLEEIQGGQIIVDGKDVSTLKGKELRLYRQRVGMIFQQFSLLDSRNVFENIALPLECNGWKKDDIKKRVEELAEVVGLSDKLQNKSTELSGGQKQRVAIARSLALNPEILLCDEATSALDPKTTRNILTLLKKINRELGITIIIVTHQMEVVKEACDEIAILKNGKIIEKGETASIFLSSNNALKTIIEEEEILPEDGVNIRIYFPRDCAADHVITSMARKLDIDFSICYGKLEKFQEDVLGSLIINIYEKDRDNVIKYLEDVKIPFEIVDPTISEKEAQ